MVGLCTAKIGYAKPRGEHPLCGPSSKPRPSLTKMVSVPIPPCPVPRMCICNEWVSLHSRVIAGEGFDAQPWLVHAVMVAAAEIAAALPAPIKPMDLEQWLASCQAYTVKRKDELRRAHTSLSVRGLSRLDAKIETFLKFEKLTGHGDPRVIQPTSDRYLVAIAPGIKAVDKALASGFYEFTRGLDYQQLGRLFAEHVSKYADPVCASADYSRFDAHVGPTMLMAEHLVYLTALGDESFSHPLAWQLQTIGRTRSGIKYHRDGGRCSGHPNTSCGNGILNLLMHRVVLRAANVRASVFVNGDDTLILCERRHAHCLTPAAYKSFGMEIEITISEIDHADYCSGRFMPVGNGEFEFIRDLPKALLKLPWVLRALPPRAIKTRRHDVFHAELSQNPRVPLLTAFCSYWHRGCPGRVVNARNLSWRHQDITLDLRPGAVQAESREWFQRVYGVPIAIQLMAEADIAATGWHPVLKDLALRAYKPDLELLSATHDGIFDLNMATWSKSLDELTSDADYREKSFPIQFCDAASDWRGLLAEIELKAPVETFSRVASSGPAPQTLDFRRSCDHPCYACATDLTLGQEHTKHVSKGFDFENGAIRRYLAEAQRVLKDGFRHPNQAGVSDG